MVQFCQCELFVSGSRSVRLALELAVAVGGMGAA